MARIVCRRTRAERTLRSEWSTAGHPPTDTQPRFAQPKSTYCYERQATISHRSPQQHQTPR